MVQSINNKSIVSLSNLKIKKATMNKIISVIIIIISANLCFSQQYPVNNFYIQNPSVINPAYTGMRGTISGFYDFRDHWSGLKGAPETMFAGIDGLITNNMGVGLKVMQNKEGIFSQFAADVDYSYRLAINEIQSIAMGLSVGIMQSNINMQNVVAENMADPALSSNYFNEAMLYTGIGFAYNRKDLTASLSSPIFYSTQDDKLLQTSYFFSGYDFYISDKIWRIQPSIMVQYMFYALPTADINVIAEWDEKLWLQTSYRTDKSILISGGIFVKNIGIGYCYDINMSEMSNVVKGSHEIMLMIESPYSLTKKKAIYQNSRRRRNSWR